jgi:hypothetical protein
MFNIDLTHERYCNCCHKLKESSKFAKPHMFFKQASKCDSCINKQIAQKKVNKLSIFNK